MRKILLALGSVLMLSSFTITPDKTTVLKDIDGTLLKSFVTINEVNGEYIATFTVDANTIVTTNSTEGITNIYLIGNGESNVRVQKSIKFKTYNIAFNNLIEVTSDIVSTEDVNNSNISIDVRPKRIIRT